MSTGAEKYAPKGNVTIKNWHRSAGFTRIEGSVENSRGRTYRRRHPQAEPRQHPSGRVREALPETDLLGQRASPAVLPSVEIGTRYHADGTVMERRQSL